MGINQLFEWDGFKYIDLYNDWEIFKDQAFVAPIILPNRLSPLDSRISDLYCLIFTSSKLRTKDEVISRSVKIYTLLNAALSYLEEEVINYSDKYDELMKDLEDTTPVLLLDIAHYYVIQNSNHKQHDEIEDYLILGLMLIDQYLGLSGESKYIAAYDALNCYSEGFATLNHNSTISQGAKRKVLFRHKKSREVKRFALEIADRIKNEKSNISIRQLALRVSNDVKKYADDIGFRYTDRFEQTIYEWLLKYFSK